MTVLPLRDSPRCEKVTGAHLVYLGYIFLYQEVTGTLSGTSRASPVLAPELPSQARVARVQSWLATAESLGAELVGCRAGAELVMGSASLHSRSGLRIRYLLARTTKSRVRGCLLVGEQGAW